MNIYFIMKKEQESKYIKYLRSLIIRSMAVILMFFILGILSKSNKQYKNIIIHNVYEKNLTFSKIKNIYQKYLGGIEPLEKAINNNQPVFHEELEYFENSLYRDGVQLKVTKNYLVPIQNEGMVIYIGEKEYYDNTIIIEGVDGIDIWYGNLENTSVKLYDYVEKGKYLGTTKNDILYLAYQKDGKFINPKEYLK